MKYIPIDNLKRTGTTERREGLSLERAKEISGLIQANIVEANKANILEANPPAYDEATISQMAGFFTPEFIQQRVAAGYFIYVDHRGEVVACGLAMERDGKYEIKMVHVRSDMRGMRIGKGIMLLLEDRIAQAGAAEVHIEAMKFPNSLGFYEKLGYRRIEEEASEADEEAPEECEEDPFKDWFVAMKKKVEQPA